MSMMKKRNIQIQWKWILAGAIFLSFLLGFCLNQAKAEEEPVEVQEINSAKELLQLLREVDYGTEENGEISFYSIDDEEATPFKEDEGADPRFISRTIYVFGEKPEDDCGAMKMAYLPYVDTYLLFYDTPAMAKTAFEKLSEEYDCAPDEVIDVCTNDDAAYGSEVSFQTEGVTWGRAYMAMDRMSSGEYDRVMTVAVLDSGALTEAAALEGRLSSDSFDIVNDREIGEVDTLQFHGTHICSTIAQCTPANVQILAVGIFTAPKKTTTTYMYAGLQYAYEHGADIMNLSFGGKVSEKNAAMLNTMLEKITEEGGTVCCAAGNESRDIAEIFPASSPYTIAVVAIDPEGNSTWFDNYGEEVDFAAPGTDISIYVNEVVGIITESGTSMASPHVVAALADIACLNPDMSAKEILDTAIDLSVDLGEEGKDDIFGYGYIDLSSLFEEEPGTAIMTATAMGYREADIQSEAVRLLEEGSVLWVEEVLVTEENGETREWIRIQEESGDIYIEKKYCCVVDETSGAIGEAIGLLTVRENTSVYVQPLISEDIQQKLPYDSQLTFYKQSGNWYRVRTETVDGWVRVGEAAYTGSVAEYLKVTTAMTTAVAEYHCGPGNFYETQGSLKEGKLVNVYEIKEGWYKVFREGKFMWINGSDLYDIQNPPLVSGSSICQMTAITKTAVYLQPWKTSEQAGMIGQGKVRNVYAICGEWVCIYMNINGTMQYAWIDGRNMQNIDK